MRRLSPTPPRFLTMIERPTPLLIQTSRSRHQSQPLCAQYRQRHSRRLPSLRCNLEERLVMIITRTSSFPQPTLSGLRLGAEWLSLIVAAPNTCSHLPYTIRKAPAPPLRTFLTRKPMKTQIPTLQTICFRQWSTILSPQNLGRRFCVRCKTLRTQVRRRWTVRFPQRPTIRVKVGSAFRLPRSRSTIFRPHDPPRDTPARFSRHVPHSLRE